MSFFAAFSPSKRREIERRKRELEAETEKVRGNLNNHVQSIQSGSRVLQNMAGAMRLQNMSHRIDRE